MKTIIESTNFEPSSSLNKFIKEKAKVFISLDKDVMYSEFNLSESKGEFTCTVILNLAGKDIVTTRKTDDIHFSVLQAIDAAKRSLRKKKMKKLTLKKKTNRPSLKTA